MAQELDTFKASKQALAAADLTVLQQLSDPILALMPRLQDPATVESVTALLNAYNTLVQSVALQAKGG